MISDFGLTRFKQAPLDRTSTGLTFEYGNSTYRAPECSKGVKVTRAADVWSLGCIFAEALTFAVRGMEGVEEFMSNRTEDYQPARDLFHTVIGQQACVKPHVLSWLTNLAHVGGSIAANFVDVLRMMLKANPSERPAIGEVVYRLQVLISEERGQLQLPPIQLAEGQARVIAATSTTEIIPEDGSLAAVQTTETTWMGNIFKGSRWGFYDRSPVNVFRDESKEQERKWSTPDASSAPSCTVQIRHGRSESAPGRTPGTGETTFSGLPDSKPLGPVNGIDVPRFGIPNLVSAGLAGLGLVFQKHTPEDSPSLPARSSQTPLSGTPPDNFSYEISNKTLLQGPQGSSVPRHIQYSDGMSPKTCLPTPAHTPDPNRRPSATPQLEQTDNPLRTLRRYDTVCHPSLLCVNIARWSGYPRTQCSEILHPTIMADLLIQHLDVRY
jgi:serine/threonine protein kinase